MLGWIDWLVGIIVVFWRQHNACNANASYNRNKATTNLRRWVNRANSDDAECSTHTIIENA